MAEEDKAAPATEDLGKPEVATEPGPQVTADAELAKQIAELKTRQSGSDKKVTELLEALKNSEGEKEELRKQSMNATEKAKYEAEKREQDLLQKEAALQARELQLQKIGVLDELELPHKLSKRIHGKTQDELIADAKEFKTEFDEAVATEVNKRLASGNGKGAGGTSGEKGSALTLDQVVNLSLEERMKLDRDQPGYMESLLQNQE